MRVQESLLRKASSMAVRRSVYARAYVAKAKYGVTDQEILSSITWHTTGKPDMTLLEKIVYIADYIEPKRDKAPNLTFVRKLAFQDLDECMYEILKDSLAYLEENPKDVDVQRKCNPIKDCGFSCTCVSGHQKKSLSSKLYEIDHSLIRIWTKCR